MTADRLTAIFTLWFPNNDGEIIPVLRAGSGKVNSHLFNLALPLGALNTGVSDKVRVTGNFPGPRQLSSAVSFLVLISSVDTLS